MFICRWKIPGCSREMVRGIDSLNEELTDLYEDMDSRVARHTTVWRRRPPR